MENTLNNVMECMRMQLIPGPLLFLLLRGKKLQPGNEAILDVYWPLNCSDIIEHHINDHYIRRPESLF